MKMYCEHREHAEIGVLEHQGRAYSALGSSVSGRSVTGYVKGTTLQTWCGATMLDSRCEVVQLYRSGAEALVFRLTRGRFIVGYSLGQGMLFRGELVDDCSDFDARSDALNLSETFSEMDSEDEYAAEQELV